MSCVVVYMKILMVRLCAGGWERAELGTWTVLADAAARQLPFVSDVMHVYIDLCPTPVARNKAVQLARQHHCDVIVSIDADTMPHRDFMTAALQELHRNYPREGCKVVVSPYVCAGDDQRVQIFRWTTNNDVQEPAADAIARFAHVSRDEAAQLTGREEVACAGTGAFAAHVAAFDFIKPPYFDYEYEPNTGRTKVVSTEDVRAFRDLSLSGVKIVCLWDCWATHFKEIALGKPSIQSPGVVADRMARLLTKSSTSQPLPQAIDVDVPEQEVA